MSEDAVRHLIRHFVGYNGGFDLSHSIRFGQLPSVYVERDPKAYLASYAGACLREEVQAEALTRNLDAFARFLTAAAALQVRLPGGPLLSPLWGRTEYQQHGVRVVPLADALPRLPTLLAG